MSLGEASLILSCVPVKGQGCLMRGLGFCKLSYANLFFFGERHNRSSNILFPWPVVGVKFLAHSCSVIAVAGPTWRAESLELPRAITPDQVKVSCIRWVLACPGILV